MEFCATVSENFFEEEGIRTERSNTYFSQQSVLSKGHNYTAVGGFKAMLKASGPSDNMWEEVLLCYTYVWNRECHGGQK